MFKKNTLELRKITGTRKWKVIKDFDFILDGTLHAVPKGFETDLASTPRFSWGVFPKSGVYTEASVIHDFMYVNALYNKKKADKTFKNALKFCGVGPIRRNVMYMSVRIGGSGNYNKVGK